MAKRTNQRKKTEEELIVRPITDRDIDQIIEIDIRVTGEPKPDYWYRKLSLYLKGGGEYWVFKVDRNLAKVAEFKGEVVGFMLGDVRSWEFGQHMCGWITDVGVDPNYQRMGVGRRLLAEFLDYFREKELKQVRTLVEWADGNIINFFNIMGFERGPFIQLEKRI